MQNSLQIDSESGALQVSTNVQILPESGRVELALTRDKLELLFREFDESRARIRWAAAGAWWATAVSLFVALLPGEFTEYWNVKGEQWAALFLLVAISATIIATYFTARSIYYQFIDRPQSPKEVCDHLLEQRQAEYLNIATPPTPGIELDSPQEVPSASHGR